MHFTMQIITKKRPFWQKLINRLNRLMGQKNVFVIKKIYN